MGSEDPVDGRTFKVNFSGSGAAKLKESVNEKLKEFMGDYTDDTLVEYIIVLLRNGRGKEEARNELNVFLGDDGHSFVSWLWDHLASNVDLYAEPQVSYMDEVTKTKPTVMEQSGRNDTSQLESELDRGKSNKLIRSRHNKEWKGVGRDVDEPPPLRSSDLDNFHSEENSHCKVSHGGHSPSPQPLVHRKRSRPDEPKKPKTGAVPQARIAPPRRLLQFAVRDAVGTSRPSTIEPSSKRLRSVVSSSTASSSIVDRPRRLRSVARISNSMATVIRAVEEAAEDVKRVKPSSVFDRLGHDMSESVRPAGYRETPAEEDDYGVIPLMEEKPGATYLRCDYNGQFVQDTTVLETESGLASDSLSDNEEYGDVNVMSGRLVDASRSGPSIGSKGENLLMGPYDLEKDSDMQKRRILEQDQPAISGTSAHKIVNISVNVNTWKPPYYEGRKGVTELNSRTLLQGSETGIIKSGARVMKENGNAATVGNAKPTADMQKEFNKPLSAGNFAPSRSLEDSDSRTIFVSNVHFAATKDSLSRHFNKFGEVVKVIIITDAATRQPKGSAYVEFMRKEAADNALSLDGTSFMSRILKVTRRNAVHQEAAAPIMTWPRVARASSFAARFSRAPFPRGMGLPGSFRPHPPIKPVARSWQWKRDAQAIPSDGGVSISGSTVPLHTARSLTYIRTEAKQDGNGGPI